MWSHPVLNTLTSATTSSVNCSTMDHFLPYGSLLPTWPLISLQNHFYLPFSFTTVILLVSFLRYLLIPLSLDLLFFPFWLLYLWGCVGPCPVFQYRTSSRHVITQPYIYVFRTPCFPQLSLSSWHWGMYLDHAHYYLYLTIAYLVCLLSSRSIYTSCHSLSDTEFVSFCLGINRLWASSPRRRHSFLSFILVQPWILTALTSLLRPPRQRGGLRDLIRVVAHYLLSIALAPSMFCPLILLLLYVIIIQHITILQILRIYYLLTKFFSINIPYLLLPSPIFLPLDTLLLLPTLILHILILPHILQFLTNETT